MDILKFTPDAYQQDLIISAMQGHPDDVLPRTQFVESIFNSRHWLPWLSDQGTDYIVAFDNHQAYSVLRNSPWVLEIAHKVGIPHSMSVFEIQDAPFRRNPDEEEGFLTEEDVEPGVDWFESMLFRYTDWGKAWWREVLQNSVDACLEATARYGRRGEIVCSIYTHENSEKVSVKVTDNGIGMDTEVLVKAFLKPGGSAKRGDYAGKPPTGGLGKAKEMLFHAWPEWSVHTQMDDGDGLYVKARYGPYVKGNLLQQAKRPRQGPGTEITVTMKEDRCIKKEDLYNFIELSSFPIKVIFRRYHVDDLDITLEEEEELKADNKITARTDLKKHPDQEPKRYAADEPNRTLERRDGSVWAEVYHMPRARKFKQAIIRASGLYLFSASSHFDLPGKVIIELKYKPKGMNWDDDEKRWVPMSPEKAAQQRMNEYGPLEMLRESRDGLINSWRRTNYQYKLDEFLEELAKKPDTVFKRKPRLKKRVRAVNRKAEKPDFDELFEYIQPRKIYDDTEKTLQDMRKVHEQELVRRMMRAVRQGDLVMGDPSTFNQVFTDGQIAMLKVLLKRPDIVQRIRESEPGYRKPVYTETTEVIEVTAEKTEEEVIAEKLQEMIDDVEYSAISTAVDTELYKKYAKILTPLLKKAYEEGKGSEHAENVIKMLKWEPDFIFSDETDKPTPRPPDKFNPTMFTAKERQVAKFWVECIRLIHMIQGSVNLDLDVGFLFENPGSDAFEGEYIADPGKAEKEGEEAYTENIGAFKAVLIAPADLGRSGQWKHRYKLRDYGSIATMVSIGFHEVVHANLHRLDEYSDHGHNAKFANMITDDLKTAMLFSAAFFELARHCAGMYKIKERGVRKGPPRRTKKPIRRGTGYYVVKCEEKGGRPEMFATLQEARDAVEEYQREFPSAECQIFAKYRPVTGSDVPALDDELESRWGGGSYWDYDLQTRLDHLRNQCDRYQRDYHGYSDIDGKDIFKRKRRLRRYNPRNYG
jgi:hypothetical protein